LNDIPINRIAAHTSDETESATASGGGNQNRWSGSKEDQPIIGGPDLIPCSGAGGDPRNPSSSSSIASTAGGRSSLGSTDVGKLSTDLQLDAQLASDEPSLGVQRPIDMLTKAKTKLQAAERRLQEAKDGKTKAGTELQAAESRLATANQTEADAQANYASNTRLANLLRSKMLDEQASEQ